MLKPQKRLTRTEKKHMKEDKLVTFWFKALEWFGQNQTYVLGGLAALIVIVAGTLFFQNYKAGQENRAAVQFANAKRLYDGQNYNAAVDTLVRLTNDFSGTPSAGVGTVYLANAFMFKKDYPVAERYYRDYLEDYGDDPILSAAASAGIAATFDERGEYAKAAELYEQAAQKFSDSYRAPQFLMDAARCYRLAEKSEAALKALALLVEKYPKSKFVEEAKLMQAELKS